MSNPTAVPCPSVTYAQEVLHKIAACKFAYFKAAPMEWDPEPPPMSSKRLYFDKSITCGQANAAAML